MNFGDDEWFQYPNEFNKQADSPGAAGQFNDFAGNIDNIPLNDDAGDLDLDLTGTFDDFQYGLASPNGLPNGHGQQPGPSSVGQYQNMHMMQNPDTFDQHMQPSTSVAYNSFEMPTVVNSNLDVDPFQDMPMDDSHMFYANQQPSTSMANDIGMSDNFGDMIGQSTSSYMPQMDQMGGPSSVSNHSQPMSQQQHQQQPMGMEMSPAAKPKSKKARPSHKKKPTGVVETVGTALTKVNKMSQQIEKSTVNDGAGGSQKIEARITAEDSILVATLMNELMVLQAAIGSGSDDPQLLQKKADLEAQIAGLFSRNIAQTGSNDSAGEILTQIQNFTAQPAPSAAPNSSNSQAKKSAAKRKGNNQHTKAAQQQQQLQQHQMAHTSQPSQAPPPKILMEPPTATLVPSSSGTSSYHNGTNENYVMYQPMDQQGTSTSSQYADYQHPDQMPTTKVVPSMNQRTHNYRNSAIYSSSQVNNAPGPSPRHADSLHHEMYDQQGSSSSHQMYVPQDDRPMYRPQEEPEETVRDALRKSQAGRLGGAGSAHDTPTLRQQLMANVNSGPKALAPTASPGNVHGNNNTMHYAEMHNSFPPRSQEPHHPSSQQHGYEQDFDAMGEYFGGPPGHYPPPHPSQQYADQTEMYRMESEQPPMEMYPPVPDVPAEMTKEEVHVKLEEAKHSRSMRLKRLMLDQLDQIEGPTDVSPFRGRLDIFQRLLPWHHFTQGDEPEPDFDQNYETGMKSTVHRARLMGDRIRSSLLRDTMRKRTEWEENMVMYLETESERRQLEEDRQLMERDPESFIGGSEIIRNVLDGRLNPEWTKMRVPPMPAHLEECDLKNGQLTHAYKEYEFDSYDVNRPRPAPTDFVYPEESESEEEEVEEEIPEQKPEEIIDEPISDLGSEFPQLSPIPLSPVRSRNESESSLGEWKDDEESPLLSPETGYAKAVEEIRREMYADSSALEKREPFPFAQISKVARQQVLSASSIDSVEESSSAGSVVSKRSVSPHVADVVRKSRSPSPVSCQPSTSTAAPAASNTPRAITPVITREREGSVETVFETPKIKVEDIKPIKVDLARIKKEKAEKAEKLTLRVSAAVFRKGVQIAASGDDSDIEEIPNERQPIKLKIKLGDIKKEVTTSKTPNHVLIPDEPEVAPVAVAPKSPVFKTPYLTPLKANSADRKRRSERIVDSPAADAKRMKKRESEDPFTTPKNPVIQERFLRTMTTGRKITMKIGKIPPNYNHFVTPRRDGKGNMCKDLSPNKHTRLKMTLTRKNGELSVKFTEKNPETGVEEELTERRKKKKEEKEKEPRASHETPTLPRPAPASRKESVDAPEKKNSVVKKKGVYSNRFNPFAQTARTSMTSESVMTPPPAPIAVASASMAPKPIPPMPMTSVPRPLPNSFTAPVPKPMPIPMPKPSAPMPKPPQGLMPMMTVPTLSSSSSAAPSTSSIHPASSSSLFAQLLQSSSSLTSLTTPIRRPAPIAPPAAVAPAPAPMPIMSTPVIPKIEPANMYVPPPQPKLSSLLPWMTDADDVRRPAPYTAPHPQQFASTSSMFPSTSTAPPAVKTAPIVKEEPLDEPTTNPMDSPRAASSMSLSFFEDSGPNFPFLHSPKRTNEPLPIVEFSDDEENDLAHSTFSHATDHLLSTSNLSNPVNGGPPILPWTRDP